MKPFRTCPHCGANLDPGEKCDCPDQTEQDARQEADVKKAG